MSKRELAVKDPPERVLTWAEQKLIGEFPYRAQVNRPVTSRNIVQAFTQYGLSPSTALGWAFNLLMLAVTLGAWAVVYLIWVMVRSGEFRHWVTISAYPSDTEGETNLVVEGNKEDWFEVVDGWVRARYEVNTT